VVNVSSAWDLATVQSGTSVPVQWLNHNKTPVDITDQLSAGKLGGLIEARDTFLTNYRGQLDTLAAGLIKAVNSLQSNGIGLTPFASQTGTNAVSDPSTSLASSAAALPFGSNILNGSSQVFVYDSTRALPDSGTVAIDRASMSLANVVTALSAIPGITARIDSTKGILAVSGTGGHIFAFASDTSNVLGTLGLNTLFTGSGARDIAVNALVQQKLDYLATAQPVPNGTYAVGDNSHALAIAALQTTLINLAGTSPTIDDFYHNLVGQIGSDARRAEQGATH
jgi:flagellar hook-associated protein 1 FlgK